MTKGEMSLDGSVKFFSEFQELLERMKNDKLFLITLESIVHNIATARSRGGRVFVLGIGGSAATASHFINDLRKACEVECYAPTDNVSELTARTNDESFDVFYEKWLTVSNLQRKDVVFILSVSGGNKETGNSLSLCNAIDLASERIKMIVGIVGKKESYLKKKGLYVLEVPIVNDKMITPYSEAMQSVILHYIISHSSLQMNSIII